MKKYVCSFLLMVFLISVGCFAQNTQLKRYSDSSMNFDGWAAAEYIGNLAELDDSMTDELMCEFMVEKLSPFLKQVTKLSKNTNWLFHQAMEEWEYEPHEFYIVLCTNDEYSEEGIMICVVVNEDKDFLWRAFMVDEEAVENTDWDEIFEM